MRAVAASMGAQAQPMPAPNATPSMRRREIGWYSPSGNRARGHFFDARWADLISSNAFLTLATALFTSLLLIEDTARPHFPR